MSEDSDEERAPLALLDGGAACSAAPTATEVAVESDSLSAFLLDRDRAPPSRPVSLLPEESLVFF